MSQAPRQPAPLPDPYDLPPPWWKTHETALSALSVFVLTVVLTVISFPPYELPEFAYAFATPALLWAYRRPDFKLYAGTVLGAGAVAWTIILGWLHHVTWVGLFLLGPVVGLWIGVWFLAAWWWMPRLLGRGTLERIAGLLGLAALWVVVEWTRTWVLTGFPWLPLSASQWHRVSILQISAFTGAWGVSFVLISMNIGFAAYAHRLFCEGKTGLQRRSQEFFACLFLLLVCVTIHVQESFNRGRFAVPLGRITLVQPNVPQSVKWDPAKGESIMKLLETSTLKAGKQLPDLILWPEATTPWAVLGDAKMKEWTETLSKRAKAPLLIGSVAVEGAGTSGERWQNGMFYIDPEQGLSGSHYAKRHLVPFGEYVPLRPVLGWLEKVVPVGGDTQPGDGPKTLLLPIKGKLIPFGPLICYEDIFPVLARENVYAGAEVLIVATNSAWYGESGASVQHAAHSVLRAIETRRPILRCGNNGWSGWIDEFGSVRGVIEDENGSIFMRANATLSVERDSRWIGKESFYVEHGDWFVLISLALSMLSFALLRFSGKPGSATPANTEA